MRETIPEMAEVQIRRASALDSELLARLGRETFPGNFIGREPPAAMASYIEERFTPEVMARQLSEEGSVFFIAYSGGEAIGFARLKQDNPPELEGVERTAEINRLYVLHGQWGRGVGRRLVTACIEEAIARGFESVWLAAWSENPRTLGFYRSLGFEEIGTQLFEIGEERHVDLVFRLPIASV